MRDSSSRPVRLGDAVKVAHGDWSNGVSKWMVESEGRVVALGRTRVTVHFPAHERSCALAPHLLEVTNGV
jgi:hypothetical protein